MSKLGINIFSKGLYSSWCWHKPTRTLFDCGEGFATHMGNEVFGVENVFLSHSHGDHVLGLPSFIGARNMARGDREKPLNVFYPKGDRDSSFRDLFVFISARNSGHMKYDVQFTPISPGYVLDIDENRYIQAFEMMHDRYRLTLGYKVCERTKRLKPEYAGRNIPELLRMHPSLKNEISEVYIRNSFAYCLDSYSFDPKNIENAEYAVMDCTFLDKRDRDRLTHFSLDEAKELCKSAGVKKMIAAHISPRYFSEGYRKIDAEIYTPPNKVLEL